MHHLGDIGHRRDQSPTADGETDPTPHFPGRLHVFVRCMTPWSFVCEFREGSCPKGAWIKKERLPGQAAAQYYLNDKSYQALRWGHDLIPKMSAMASIEIRPPSRTFSVLLLLFELNLISTWTFVKKTLTLMDTRHSRRRTDPPP